MTDYQAQQQLLGKQYLPTYLPFHLIRLIRPNWNHHYRRRHIL
jgi:hypothetical protein